MTSAPTMLWFRQDLRLTDQPALLAALEAGGPVLPVFVLDEAAAGRWAPGGAARWWLHHSLAALAADLAARGSMLVLRRGDAAVIIPALAAEAGITEVHTGRPPEPWARRQDQAVAKALAVRGVRLRRHRTTLLVDADALRTQAGGLYGVYTPFARACMALGPPPAPRPAPARLPAAPIVASDVLADWHLLPGGTGSGQPGVTTMSAGPDWAVGLREAWQPGEAGAALRLEAFISASLANYHHARDIPDGTHTSMLSPHLARGEISPAQVWQAALAAGDGQGVEKFLRELLWREFAAYLLWHHPDLPELPLRAEFNAFPWVADQTALRAWQRGRTGVPIVDAGMRQLWQTGWMHNRVRMVVASFLVKHLLIPWQDGQAWFWDTLVDADLASNSASWQWVAGCGADAAPFFRVFNPVLQGRKFDPEGGYVRRYVPELRGLAAGAIHAPWEVSAAYATPIVDLATGRARALDAWRRIGEKAE